MYMHANKGEALKLAFAKKNWELLLLLMSSGGLVKLSGGWAYVETKSTEVSLEIISQMDTMMFMGNSLGIVVVSHQALLQAFFGDNDRSGIGKHEMRSLVKMCRGSKVPYI